jgi:CRISPR-associated exonuclease Cas4
MFCPRQCGLIHIERLWEENFLTAKGRQMHSRVHEAEDETRENVRICRALELASESLGIFGVSDVVEYHSDGTIVPVEYKRGKPKDGREDEIQLCAQALCLEEMHGKTVSFGYLYYGAVKRRLEVPIGTELRVLTREIIKETASVIGSGVTPTGKFSKKCRSCSLYDLCMPKKSVNIRKYIAQHIEEEL